MKSLILFVHGLGGSADGTWIKFPLLIEQDPELAARYDVRAFEYGAAMFGAAPSFQTCADALKTEIETRHSAYSSIAIVAHSQGGLIARWHIADQINSQRPLRIDRLLTFATPHQGAGGASVLRWIPGASRQTTALDPNSEFMQALGLAWGQAKADQKIATRYVVAEDDWVVGPVSATGSSPIDVAVVGGAGHIDVVKPASPAASSFLVAKTFLLDDSWRPSGVEADYCPPVLRFNQLQLTEAARFIYGARALPFVGRDDELKAIDAFLGEPSAPFRWMLLHGSGGVGKSRLALELCLAAQQDWHAGFLSEGSQEPDWTRWRPMAPTLIVIDYAARDTARTGKMLRALAGRATSDGDIRRLEAPVRLILIERTSGGDWLARIIDADARALANRAPDLALKAVNDPWPFFEHILRAANKPLPGKAATLAALAEIDPERRPLFAYFMADALAEGRDVHSFDAARLVQDVIARARVKFWRPLGTGVKEERLLALATIAGGLPISAIETLPPQFACEWNIDRHPALFQAMTGRPAAEEVPPLQPDIVGEHFALACLADAALSDALRMRFLEAAWAVNPPGTAQFSLRAHRDAAGSPMLVWLRKSPANHVLAQVLWSISSVDLISDLDARDPKAARRVLDDLRDFAEARNGPALWWESWAQAAFKLAINLVARDPQAARRLLDDMREIAQARNEPALWEIWAKAATIIMICLGTRDPQTARRLLDEMREITQARNEPARWEIWVTATLVLAKVIHEQDQAGAAALVEQLKAVPNEIVERVSRRFHPEGTPDSS